MVRMTAQHSRDEAHLQIRWSVVIFCFGIILCGLKFPFNWLFADARFRDIQRIGSFGLYDGLELQDAWRRIRDPGRSLHDITNLVVEFNRRWLPVSTKFLCALIVWPNLIYLVLIVIF
jgi:hypothetical protein